MKTLSQKIKTPKKILKALKNGLLKQRALFTGLVVLGLMVATLPLSEQSKGQITPTIPWNVVETFWGTITNPMAVGPGDQNVPLSVIIQYTGSNVSVTGISIKLELFTGMYEDPPFTNPLGDPVTYPTLLGGAPTQSQTGPFNPGDVGVVQFQFNINPNITLNEPYPLMLQIMYFEKDVSINPLGDLIYKEYWQSFKVKVLGRPRFDVNILDGPLVVEEDSSISIRLVNNGTADANNVNVDLTLPPPLILTKGSTGHWEIEQIAVQDLYDINITAYAPRISVAGTYQLGILITWRDQSGFIQSETHSGGVVVHGNTERPTSDLKVEFSESSITGGRNNPILLRVSNNGAGNALDTRITVELPPPLILKGMDNQWYVEQLLAQSFKEFNITIYAPEAAIGFTYPVAVTMIFKDHMGIEQMELRQLGLMVIGEIDLLVYDFSLFPPEVPVNSNVTVSGSLLNRGNVEAMYVNVTLVGDAYFRTTAMSTYYVGQVDPNAPIPFALTAFLQEGVEEGTYSLTILIEYQDSYGGEYSLTKTTSVLVIPAEQVGPAETPSPDIIQRISDTLLRPIPLFFIALVIVILWRILRRKEEE